MFDAMFHEAHGQSGLESKRGSMVWQDEVGAGFRSGADSIGLSFGVSYGIPMLGGEESHHLALTSLSYGWMAGPTRNKGHWYRGNWEYRAEVFGGSEFSPEVEWIVGITPHLRYNFVTGTRWIPFLDLGAGVTATSIGPPDLSGIFEFNLQGCAGLRWFFRDDVALSIEARYLHISCASIHDPNLGLNGVAGFLGLTYFF